MASPWHQGGPGLSWHGAGTEQLWVLTGQIFARQGPSRASSSLWTQAGGKQPGTSFGGKAGRSPQPHGPAARAPWGMGVARGVNASYTSQLGKADLTPPTAQVLSPQSAGILTLTLASVLEFSSPAHPPARPVPWGSHSGDLSPAFGGGYAYGEQRHVGLRPAGRRGFKCQRSAGVRAVIGVLLGGSGVLGP